MPDDGVATQSEHRAPPPGTALLDTGPDPGLGILILPPNALSYLKTEYLVGSLRLVVLYTEDDFAVPEDWTTTRCGNLRFYILPEEQTIHHAYISDEGWSIFFEMPRQYEEPCRFAEMFLQRLRYFMGVGAYDEVPFPAIIEIPVD